MGSHSVTCHPTQVNAPSLNPSQTDRYLIYLPRRDGRLSWPFYILGQFTCPQTVTHPGTNHLIATDRELNPRRHDCTVTLPSQLSYSNALISMLIWLPLLLVSYLFLTYYWKTYDLISVRLLIISVRFITNASVIVCLPVPFSAKCTGLKYSSM